jgi:hypothetical protein
MLWGESDRAEREPLMIAFTAERSPAGRRAGDSLVAEALVGSRRG